MKEVKTQEYQVWRDHVTKEITRKEPTRTCLISPLDIDSMNKQMYCNSIRGGAEYYFEEIIEVKEKTIDDYTRNELLEYAKEKGIEVSVRDKKEDILNQIKESC